MKRTIYFLIILTLGLGLAGSPSAQAIKHTVQVGNFFFSPATLTVAVGDTIKWVWVAGSHTTTSTPGAIPAGAAAWDELINSSNQTYEYKVTVAGSYNYVCTPHVPGMVASFTATGFTPTLSVAPSNRIVASSAGATTFSVTSNTSWTASSNASWCTVTNSGTGNGTINAIYGENTSLIQRVASITVSVSGLPNQTVTVTQSGAAPVLSVSPSSQSVSAIAGTTSFDVTSNTSWTVTSDASWCTATSPGSGNGTITATYETNTTFQTRTATLTVSVAGLSPQPVTVTQAASTVGIGDATPDAVRVYPNPARGHVHIDLGKMDATEGSLTVSDISGKVILSCSLTGEKEMRIDLEGHRGGYYFIRIGSQGNTRVQRILLLD